MKKHVLSKSTYMLGLQCEKALYLRKYHYKLQDPITEEQQAIFDSGHDIGEAAQDLFPGGVDCSPASYFNWIPSIEKTKKLIAEKQAVIYEAAFQHDGVMAALDLLVNRNGKWYGYEVKGTTEVKKQHIADVSLQYYVITASGLELEDIFVVHLNNRYIRQGKIDVAQLFTQQSVILDVEANNETVKKNIQQLKETLQFKRVPNIAIGAQCKKPYPCPFIGHCWKDVPEYSVLNLTRGGKKSWELFNENVLDIKDIPDDVPLTFDQAIQVHAEKTQETRMDEEGIAAFIAEQDYPLYYFDFETISSGIPLFNQSRPYQPIPFQYSLHIQQAANSIIEHKEFLADPTNGDPRIHLMDQMLRDLGTTGSILVYYQSFEESRLNELARDFPEYAEQLESVIERLVDLALPFQYKHYYNHHMQGSFSIKKVLPALIPDLSYKDLTVQEGTAASRLFLSMMNGTFQGDEAATRADLLAYCKLDTWAMVKILEKLQQEVNE